MNKNKTFREHSQSSQKILYMEKQTKNFFFKKLSFSSNFMTFLFIFEPYRESIGKAWDPLLCLSAAWLLWL